MSKRKVEDPEDLDSRATKKQNALFRECLKYLEKKRQSGEEHPGSDQDYDSDPGSFYDKDFSADDDEKDAEGSKENRADEKADLAEEALDEEVKAVLGEDPTESKALQIKLHTSVQRRWKFWFENGLSREDKDSLLGKYGCPLGIEVPDLNPEIALKLQPHAKTRDSLMCKRQLLAGSALNAIGALLDSLMCKRQLLAGSALNAIGALLSTFIEEKEDVDKRDCLEKLQDAGKLIAELMNSQTKSRRALILAGVDKQTKTMLDETKPDKFLFGEKLSEKVRESKNLEGVAFKEAARKEAVLIKFRPPTRLQFTERQRTHRLQGQLPQSAIQPESAVSGSEPVQKSGSAEIDNVGTVVGRVRFFVKAWEKITSDKFILGCVAGYKIVFFTEVFQDRPPKQKDFSQKEFRALEISISALLRKGAIEPCRPHKDQFLSSYFLVPKSDDSSQYVLELPLNKRKVLLDCIESVRSKRRCSILDFAKLIGRLVAACPAVEYGVVYTKALERVKTIALVKNEFNYNEKMSVPKSILPDLA
ncbi:hypothetical protein TSAR_005435, partial [Trichomalopsis sarcophagae]